jgi:Zn-dependent protease
MFQIPPETPYDLRFSIFRVPVRVHPFFWLIGLVIGWSVGDVPKSFTFLFCFFFSILIHELGHALSARQFGWPPVIVLYAFGGLASYQPTFGYSRKRAIWIAFAGPLAGFILAGLTYCTDYGWNQAIIANQEWAINLRETELGRLLDYMLYVLRWINIAWGLFNLLPVPPLDGGQICSELCNARQLRSGRIRAQRIGAVTGVLAAGFFFANNFFIAGLMFAGLAYENYRLQDRPRGI